MKRIAIVVLALLALSALAGCKGLDPKLTGPAVFHVCDQLDVYVDADPALEPVQKKAKKQTTEMLRAVWIKAGYDEGGE